ncbi:uncharacterized protein LOC106460703 [Limulus polyphemus]|uniref:Uncharacterized protein LOC106460703 n=1 Tax=Limulus polyphemus TaxID=6850 RepID=A0ABM1B6P3_LIMPO|nr:uncharacterized protein LOC106460703 [Limulus polyphemus]
MTMDEGHQEIICDKPSCQQLREMLDQTKKEEALKFAVLKQKIISTDILIRKYSAKRQECDHQSQRLEDMSKLVDQLRSDCAKYEAELSRTLQEMEPLKKSYSEFEEKRLENEKKLTTIQDKLAASEVLVQQYKLHVQSLEQNSKQQKSFDFLEKQL